MAPSVAAVAVAAHSLRERKRSDEVFFSPGSDRRVTFSPFTKIKHAPRPRRFVNAQDPQKMTSGFVFASGTEMEKRKQAKKKQELQMMEKLYLASRKRSLGWKDMLLENFTILKRVQDWGTQWMDLFNSSSLSTLLRKKNAQTLRRRKTRRSIRARREALQWTAFDQADHEYMKQLTLPASSTESTVNNVIVPNGKHVEFISEEEDPVPDLTPLKQGSFSNLLRKEGIPVDEDEQREKLAMEDDLRGVGHASIRLKVSRH
uniref:Uncharacterized protein n=1 Tax=Globisporangium ultimum (strain ATCC 200006 / CBS 805.95 / DAOM BR144) TaxID=431595 RepID=K3X259_GLOUD